MADVFIAYLHRNDIGYNFHTSLLELLLASGSRHSIDVRDKHCTPLRIPEGRNAIATEFVASDREWLLMIDDDMGFQASALDNLLAVADPVERPIIGGLCFSQRDPINDGRGGLRWQAKPTIWHLVDTGKGHLQWAYQHHYPVNSLVRCDGTGGAMVLIHRTVFERLGDGDWFTLLDDHDGKVSEDLSFSQRCRDAGIPLHIHTGVKTNHMKPTWVSETDFWEQFDPPPATEQVDVIVPVLHRPQNVRPFMQSLRASTGLATAWFVCERNDKVEQAEVEANGGRVMRHDGTFAEKVNYAYKRTAAPWLFLVGDDVQFRPGWLDHAQFVGNTYGGSVVGTNDLGNPRVLRGDHATHMLIRRSYVDEIGASWDGPGVVCHEYGHNFVDDELVAAARQRGVWQMAMGSIVEHMHPVWDKALDDDVYAAGREHFDRDRSLWNLRLEMYGGQVAA